MFMVCSYRHLRCNMPDQLFLPGFERAPAFDVLFFALLLEAESASRIVKLRQRLCEEFGLCGRRIAADLLHISLHGIGAYDGLPRAVVQRAKEAGAAVLAKPFDIVLDRAMSFGPKRELRPFVLRTGDEAALVTFHRLLAGAMKNAGFRRIASRFTPHMTLLYGDRAVVERSIDAIQWTVRDFVLIQSLRGRGKHIHLARWSLRG
jgi:RNA 2',3'-cyclic 3'-phosphodiesterase